MKCVIGFMSGIFLDGVDVVFIEIDGEMIWVFGFGMEVGYFVQDWSIFQDVVDCVLDWGFEGEQLDFVVVEVVFICMYVVVVCVVLDWEVVDVLFVDLVGFYGQIVLYKVL